MVLLNEAVATLHSSCCFPCGLHCRKQEGNQYADDGNDDKKFDESEAYSTGLVSLSVHLREVNFAALCCANRNVNIAFSFLKGGFCRGTVPPLLAIVYPINRQMSSEIF
jgi:hypothetical protein